MTEYVVLIVGDADRWWTIDEPEGAQGRLRRVRPLRRGAGTGAATRSPAAPSCTRRSEAKSIRPGSAVVTDGPFTETAEQVGGFYLVETDDLDDLLDCCRSSPPSATASRCDGRSTRPSGRREAYVVLIAYDPGRWESASEAVGRSTSTPHHAFEQYVDAHGRRISSAPLAGADTATTIRHVDGAATRHGRPVRRVRGAGRRLLRRRAARPRLRDRGRPAAAVVVRRRDPPRGDDRGLRDRA